MFGSPNSSYNGEQLFFNSIKDRISVIFDIGCRADSEFIVFDGEVHYFDPVSEFIEKLSTQPNRNKKSYFNNFGLGEENKQAFYYPTYQSFYDRINSCGASDDANKVTLNIKKGKDYMAEKNITAIDFLKIDTEGYELGVLKGFEEQLRNVKIVQFEYGGTFMDSNTRLIDVVEYLKSFGFDNFSYITSYGLVPITEFADHYKYSNIVCFNSGSA